MEKERMLKFVMIAAGLLFVAGVYPLATSLWNWQHSDEFVPMLLSVYITLGVFLLIAARNPSTHRSLISFAAWSSLAHAFVMLIQAINDIAGRLELFGMSAVLVVIGVPLIALAPAKRSSELAPVPNL